MVDGDDSFKRPGAVPFKWEIRPGVPKTRPGDDDPALLQPPPPNKLPPLKLKSTPPSNSPSPSSSSSFFSESRSRPVSPFAPPPSSFKLKSPSDSDSNCSASPTPYFRSSSPRAGGSLPRCFFPKSLFGLKKSKSGDLKKTGQQEPSSTTSESDNFYESGTTLSPSEEDSSQGSPVSSRWSSPKSSFSSRRGSPLKRTDSDLSSYEKKTMLMIARSRLG
ncbi:hypothetical protein AtNW77_Chr1g0024361 [Arabidopsis thaliana]|uniref:Hydroxyproline-rich glycoprotein family protein n=2 Tax=Arabidopsis TaxID=3701 RepID=A0A8T2GIK6_9BRAS|nr:hypothetical protein ISN45_At01g021970 [Arabidopsis thaliana x Arabidopsis arenosa]OAP18600.1 hypothetical protein AXX17_AT1G22780 [Arabidopsis thaliana]CAA0229868.1 unnamed protein product [Arabidopsis thaliana]CAD5313390.1 unnamed protein product [Arabidopsis thaliana]VYS46813.1 unnamed protein product [Arabidopsis thaliana]